jgi:hypothetical protein
MEPILPISTREPTVVPVASAPRVEKTGERGAREERQQPRRRQPDRRQAEQADGEGHIDVSA